MPLHYSISLIGYSMFGKKTFWFIGSQKTLSLEQISIKEYDFFSLPMDIKTLNNHICKTLSLCLSHLAQDRMSKVGGKG